MAADPFCCGMKNDICTVIDRPADISSDTERIIDDKRYAVPMRDTRQSLKIRDIQSRIADRFHIQRFCLLVDKCFKIFRVVAVDKFRINTELFECDFKLVVGASVQAAGRNKIFSFLKKGRQCDELRSVSGCSCKSADSSFKRGDPFLKNRNGRIHHTGINIAEFLKPEEAGCMVGIAEHIR